MFHTEQQVEQQVEFDMVRGRSLRFADGVEHRLYCLTGALALTRSGQSHAAVLEYGDSYQCDGANVVTVHALVDTRVRLLSPAAPPLRPAPMPVSARAAGLPGWLARWLH